MYECSFSFTLLSDMNNESAKHYFRSEPLACRSLHYDLVLNGQEIAGGSVRIHSLEDQKFVLEDVLQEDSSELHHLLSALGSGCPPHAG